MSQPAKKGTRRPARNTAATGKTSKGFTDEERSAMKARAQELKAEARANKDKAEGERDLLAKIAAMRDHVAGRVRVEGADRRR
jgi:hypothetical protein